ncbi:hypothetical protein STEG23_025702 [Scotinomys teguina]
MEAHNCLQLQFQQIYIFFWPPRIPELKPKRASTPRKVRTTNVVVEENKDAGAITIPEPKPDNVKEEGNTENAGNGGANVTEAPIPKTDTEGVKEQRNEDTEDDGGEREKQWQQKERGTS